MIIFKVTQLGRNIEKFYPAIVQDSKSMFHPLHTAFRKMPAQRTACSHRKPEKSAFLMLQQKISTSSQKEYPVYVTNIYLHTYTYLYINTHTHPHIPTDMVAKFLVVLQTVQCNEVQPYCANFNCMTSP